MHVYSWMAYYHRGEDGSGGRGVGPEMITIYLNISVIMFPLTDLPYSGGCYVGLERCKVLPYANVYIVFKSLFKSSNSSMA